MIVRSCKEIKHHKWVFISIELGYYVKDRSLVRNKERGVTVLYLTFVIIVCFAVSFLMTPVIKKLAFKIKAVDEVGARKVHRERMARLGGAAVYVSFLIGMLLISPDHHHFWPIMLGGLVIIITGLLDDIYAVSASKKLLGQSAAALIVIFGGLYVEVITLPFGIEWYLGLWGLPLAFLWIIGITNAINLIDGLDGLAAGVSAIVFASISVLAILGGNELVTVMSLVLLAGTLGFLIFNFHPATIFMGDTGSLFLGFMIAVLSLLGFKTVTLFSLLVPIVLLAVPIADTLFSILRRYFNKKPISAPDKSHIHHRLLKLGFSHKKTVLMIYGLSIFFSAAAIMLAQSTLLISIFIVVTVVVTIELLAELIGLVHKDYRPLLNVIERIIK
jgi:UDP-GlcNAc:undecaprenyl-phosphate/decaprenyl-phosphate GlcNAc-1-phosphate transferase